MTLVPYTVARFGMYCAVLIAAGSVFLGYRAGASLDYVVLRGVIVFAVFAALAITAEFILIWDPGREEPVLEEAAEEEN